MEVYCHRGWMLTNDFLQEEKAYANEVANVLDIPFKICSQDEMDAQIENISCYLESE